MHGGAAGSGCPALPGRRGGHVAFGIWGGGAPSRQRSAGPAAGRHGVRCWRPHSLEPRLGRAGARLELQPEPLAAPPGRRPGPQGGQVWLSSSGPRLARRNQELWGSWREAAGRLRRGAPVPTKRLSHGWSEVLFLKRLQGGHKQPPTSLPARAVYCQLCAGRGAGLCTWRQNGGTAELESRGSEAPTQAGGQAHAPPHGGLEAQGRKHAESRCPAAGERG